MRARSIVALLVGMAGLLCPAIQPGRPGPCHRSTRPLRHLGLPTDVPQLSPARGPPFWQSTVLRRRYGLRPKRMRRRRTSRPADRHTPRNNPISDG